MAAVGGLWVAATSADASPLFGFGRHDQGSALGQDYATTPMLSHGDVMQGWTPSGDGPNGSGNNGAGNGNGNGGNGNGAGGNGFGNGNGFGGGNGGGAGAGATTPATTAPATTVPGTTAPGTTAPGTTAPGTGTPGTTPGAGAPAVTPGTSTNWSGYVDTGAKFTSVSAGWTQPTANCAGTQTFSSFWVGLDGDGSNSVEQTGSEADCQNGAPVYFGWFEMFPAAPVQYNKPVAAGDAMSASVTTDGNGNFTLTLTDSTQGWNQVTQQTSNTAQLASAEVVAEAPSNGNGVLPLTDFGTVNFANATANGAPIGNVPTNELTMVSPGGVTEATPSQLAGGGSFSVTFNNP